MFTFCASTELQLEVEKDVELQSTLETFTWEDEEQLETYASHTLLHTGTADEEVHPMHPVEHMKVA